MPNLLRSVLQANPLYLLQYKSLHETHICLITNVENILECAILRYLPFWFGTH